jgi:lysophospholipase L1-like esterase
LADDRANVGRALLLGSGLLYLLAALLYDPRVLAPLASEGFGELTLEKIRGVRGAFAIAGLVLIALSPLARRLASASAVTALLALLGLAVPLSLLDCGLRPFVEPKNALYQPDRELGWKLVPGAEDEDGGVRVRINEDGLRGPRAARPKPAGVTRILWLGDSVTFGYGVARDEDTFPFLVAKQLGTESVNAGVGGYAPWQELAWLEREGWSYEPDRIVVGFVLNDLTEPLSLVRYGGQGEGWQLARTARSRLDRWLSASALATFLRDGLATLRFGRDVQLGAQALEAADVKRMVSQPDAPLWQRSWSITEANLAKLFASARAHDVPVVLVIFPYAFQLEAPDELSGPQRRLEQIAKAANVRVLDLLPVLAPHGRAMFLDESHLSTAGHERVAAALYGFLE